MQPETIYIATAKAVRTQRLRLPARPSTERRTEPFGYAQDKLRRSVYPERSRRAQRPKRLGGCFITRYISCYLNIFNPSNIVYIKKYESFR